MTTDVEQVARSLTKAQTRLLLQIGGGQPREFPLGRPGFALLRRQLVFVNDLGARHLTDEGHAVRAYLMEHPND